MEKILQAEQTGAPIVSKGTLVVFLSTGEKTTTGRGEMFVCVSATPRTQLYTRSILSTRNNRTTPQAYKSNDARLRWEECNPIPLCQFNHSNHSNQHLPQRHPRRTHTQQARQPTKPTSASNFCEKDADQPTNQRRSKRCPQSIAWHDVACVRRKACRGSAGAVPVGQTCREALGARVRWRKPTNTRAGRQAGEGPTPARQATRTDDLQGASGRWMDGRLRDTEKDIMLRRV
ncbi:hypothetical protein IWX90DRAFT_258394 [Phyllosticta citrichinensis]|uniref:Uncharacterized protein n=1 Tax=Phyllosticta citrichinensis TaxID=1130410 RepID=A0ABR1XRS4_9PEZI